MKFIWKCSDDGDDVIHVGHAKVRWSAPECACFIVGMDAEVYSYHNIYYLSRLIKESGK